MTEQPLPLVYMLVLNWNGWQDTLTCLASLQRLEYAATRVLVIDNGSTDDSLDHLRAACSSQGDSRVELLALGANLGFAGGMNRGIEHALAHGAEYVFLLNNDTVVAPDALTRLMNVAQAHEEAGLLGCEVRSQEANEGTGYVLVGFDWWRGAARTWNVPPGGDDTVAVEVVLGCGVLARRSLIERIGLLDERYFLYFEDVEWSLRAVRAGFTCLLVRGAVVRHGMGATTRGARKRPLWTFYYYHTRNNILFMREYASRRALLTFVPLMTGRAIWTAVRVVGGGVLSGRANVLPRLLALWEGYTDGWRGRWGGRAHTALAEGPAAVASTR